MPGWKDSGIGALQRWRQTRTSWKYIAAHRRLRRRGIPTQANEPCGTRIHAGNSESRWDSCVQRTQRMVPHGSRLCHGEVPDEVSGRGHARRVGKDWEATEITLDPPSRGRGVGEDGRRRNLPFRTITSPLATWCGRPNLAAMMEAAGAPPPDCLPLARWPRRAQASSRRSVPACGRSDPAIGSRSRSSPRVCLCRMVRVRA